MIANIEWSIYIRFTNQNGRGFCVTYKVEAPTRELAKAKALAMYMREYPENEGWVYDKMKSYRAKRSA